MNRTTFFLNFSSSQYYPEVDLSDSNLGVSFIAVAMNSRDQYEIIGLRKISHFMKQPCRNVGLHKYIKVAETMQYPG